jgi:hypothetical protein
MFWYIGTILGVLGGVVGAAGFLLH